MIPTSPQRRRVWLYVRRGVNLPKLLLDTGVIDVAMSTLKAYELRGVSKVAEANVCNSVSIFQARATSTPTARQFFVDL